ncbi:MAG TPA: hypothetical protein GXX38_10530 [Clostridia bacterium]|nr:hypothetical protein [Clostridia bacterium]
MTIADLIREKLSMCPEGAFTSEIALYCLQNGAQFNTMDIKKSVSGQLSKMREAGYVTYEVYGREYRWRLVRFRNYNSEPQIKWNEEYDLVNSVNSEIEDRKDDSTVDFSENSINEQKTNSKLEILGRTNSIPHRVIVKSIFFDENKIPISVVESYSKKIDPGEIERFDLTEYKDHVIEKIRSYDLVVKHTK